MTNDEREINHDEKNAILFLHSPFIIRHSMTPSIVVFDLGKVLVDFDYSIAARQIAERSARPAVEIKTLLDHSPLLYRYETGLMRREEFFAEVRQAPGVPRPAAEVRGFLGD